MLALSICLALAAAVGYGVATALEHLAVSAGAGGWRDPRWRSGILLDGVAVLLQAAALATGPVILVQPCLVLALPVALLTAWRLGAARPTGVQYGACGLIVAGLAAFFVLVGDPGDNDPLRLRTTLVTAAVLLAAGTAVLTYARRWPPRARATALGLVAGCCAGLAAVLLDAVAAAAHQLGRDVLTDPDAVVAAVLLVPSAAASFVLLQLAFAADGLGVGYPADLIADPITAVLLGALLLHEDIPHTPRDYAVFGLSLLVIVAGVTRVSSGVTSMDRGIS
ncbi:DMT family transporter [Dactylosporangium sp. NPDC051541]|uniref:DMT family transporter n=1 Tax=Dactylosporangium sp. NPDC051541 TaxID=3363977 RepID=UPI00378EB53F